MTKWSRVQDSFERAHSDLFSDSQYRADFFSIITQVAVTTPIWGR